jgi:hypothetical protein
MPELVTPWAQLPDVELSKAAQGGVHKTEAPLHQNAQWIDGGDGTVIPTAPEPNDSLTVMRTTPTIWESGNDAWGVEYSRQLIILYHRAWSQNWLSHEIVRTLAVPVIDNDANDWRITATLALMDAFEADNPDLPTPNVEWEGWDGITPTLFGSHRNRRVTFDTFATGGASEAIGIDDGPGSPSPRPGQVDAEVLFPPVNLFVVPGQVPGIVSGTYTMATQGSTNQIQQSHTLEEFVDFAHGSPTAQLVAALPSTWSSQMTVEVDDALYEANAALLQHTVSPWRRTRSMLLWAIPDSDVIRRDKNGQLLEFHTVLTMTSTFTPPRYRFRYTTFDEPYQRIFPRDDGLAGGAERTWPPSKGVQLGNRTSAGYL